MPLLHFQPIGCQGLCSREPEAVVAPDTLPLDEHGECTPQPEVDLGDQDLATSSCAWGAARNPKAEFTEPAPSGLRLDEMADPLAEFDDLRLKDEEAPQLQPEPKAVTSRKTPQQIEHDEVMAELDALILEPERERTADPDARQQAEIDAVTIYYPMVTGPRSDSEANFSRRESDDSEFLLRRRQPTHAEIFAEIDALEFEDEEEDPHEPSQQAVEAALVPQPEDDIDPPDMDEEGLIWEMGMLTYAADAGQDEPVNPQDEVGVTGVEAATTEAAIQSGLDEDHNLRDLNLAPSDPPRPSPRRQPGPSGSSSQGGSMRTSS